VVELTGYPSAEQPICAYRAAEVFVFQSYWADGFPTVVTEAM
jgi:glycosyltransferase involved in cell wall biosynthesis